MQTDRSEQDEDFVDFGSIDGFDKTQRMQQKEEEQAAQLQQDAEEKLQQEQGQMRTEQQQQLQKQLQNHQQESQLSTQQQYLQRDSESTAGTPRSSPAIGARIPHSPRAHSLQSSPERIVQWKYKALQAGGLGHFFPQSYFYNQLFVLYF